MLAQSAPASCPAERPVDDIITEVHKQQSNKKHRNPNPISRRHLHLGLVSRPFKQADAANLSRIHATSEESQRKREHEFQQGSSGQV
jgi:hypothetical protein